LPQDPANELTALPRPVAGLMEKTMEINGKWVKDNERDREGIEERGR